MKNIALFVFCAALVLPVISFPIRAAAAPAYDGGTTFRDMEGKEWSLSEVREGGKTVLMDRKALEADNMGGVYTISFQEGRLSGMGAPNRYFAPYTSGGNRTLTIGNVASTLMLAFREPEGLKENEYFNYLSNVTRWDLSQGKLELHSTDSNRAEAVLIFTSN